VDAAAALQKFLLLRAGPLYLFAALIEQTRSVQQSLRESEQRFRYLADNAPVLIWMSGTDKLCNFFNKVWLDFTGRSFEQESGNGWAEGVHPEDLKHCLDIYQSHFDARKPFEMDYRLRRRDGEYRWVLDNGVPRFGTNGTFLGYIGTAIDVTDRRRQEAALRESEERYREVVESQSEFVCRFRADLTLTFVNGAYCRLLGRKREELLETSLLTWLPERARELARTQIDSCAARRASCAWECEVVLPSGEIGWQHWRCHAILGPDGSLIEHQAIGHDITDRKHAEEATRKLAHTARLAVVGELTAMVAHEVNQPLCAIMSNAEAAEMLLESADPPLSEVRQILADICQDDLRAHEAIRRIRALVQNREMQLQPLDLNRTITDVLRISTGDSLRRRVRIAAELGENLPAVTADRLYLTQVLLNLIVNGMDAMTDIPEASRQLIVQTTAKGTDRVEVTVTDCGHGIADEQMPHLFDSFFTTKPDGMGLGLSIARSIVQAHHGDIWAENLASGGASFHFTLRPAAHSLST
jgi:PAS domain S-box-containing protein